MDLNRRLFMTLSLMGAAGLSLENYAEANSGVKRPEHAMSHMMNWPPKPKGAPPDGKGNYREFHIDVQLMTHEIVPGMLIHTLGFNGQVPGPLLRVKEGEWVKVNFRNKTPLMHTIHWHGLTVPYAMDGVPYVTQPPVMPGKEYVYRFKAEPYGTHFYHCHWGTVLHMHAGMYGGFIVESDNDPIRKKYGYTREYILILSALDSNFIRNELNNMLQRMAQRMTLMKAGRLDSWTTAHFDSLDDFKSALKRGFVPPYARSRRAQASLPSPDFFTINGKSYPATEPIHIRENETIRVRLMNAGSENHHMHLHGHDFLHVCNDGAPLTHPIVGNTLPVGPGKTADIIIKGTNPGIWTFHDHDTRRVTNNGMYPGGCLTTLNYDGLQSHFKPSIALDE